MRTLYYAITAKSPLIFSESTRTGQLHQVCDHIPATALWGTISGRLYSVGEIDEAEIWDLMYSDNIQIQNGYISAVAHTDNTLVRCLPNAVAWNMNKYEPHPHAPKIYNSIQGFDNITEQFQPKQMRSGFINEDLKAIKVKTQKTAKTAIDFATKSAKESALYSYEALSPEQIFIVPIRFLGNSQTEDNIELIDEAMLSIRHLGRSRSGEFGEVTIRLLNPEAKTDGHSTESKINHPNAPTVLFCLSDVYLPHATVNEYPLRNTGIAELDNAQINWDKSAILRKSLRLYNRKRGNFDSALALIAKGSVLLLTKPLSIGTLQHLQQHGLGLKKAMGFGEVQVNPSWSQAAIIHSDVLSGFTALPIAASLRHELGIVNDAGQTKTVTTALLQRLQERQQVSLHTAQLSTSQQAVYRTILQALEQAHLIRSKHTAVLNNQVGPTRTQWNLVLSTCRQFADEKDQGQLYNALFDVDKGVIRNRSKANTWGIECGAESHTETLAEVLQNAFRNSTGKELQDVLYRCTHMDLRMLSTIKQELAFLKNNSLNQHVG